MKSPVDVLVVGGGVSGLCLSYYLQKKGVDFALLEASERTGGWIRTAYTDWGQLEMGPRGIRLRGEGGRAFIKLVRELSIENRLIGASTCAGARHILLDGKLEKVGSYPWNWPFSKATKGLASALIQEISGIRSLKNFFHEVARKQPLDLIDDRSIEDFLSDRFGYELYERLFEPALVGVFGASGHDLSAATCLASLWSAYQSSGSVLRGLLIEGLKGAFKEKNISMSPWNSYPLVSFDKGLQVLVEALYEKIRASFFARQKVQTIQWDARLGLFRVQSSSRLWLAKRVVVATSPWSLGAGALDLMNWNPLLSGVQPHSLALVHVGLTKELRKQWGFGYLVSPRLGGDLLGVVMDSNLFPQHDTAGIHRMTLMMKPPVTKENFDSFSQRAIERVGKHLGESLEPCFVRHFFADRALGLYRPGFMQMKQKLNDEVLEKKLPLHFLGMGYGAFSVSQCLTEVEKMMKEI